MTNLKVVPDIQTLATKARYTPLRVGQRTRAPSEPPIPQVGPRSLPLGMVDLPQTPAPAPAPMTAPVTAPMTAPVTAPAPVFSPWRALGGAIVGASVPASVFTVSHTTSPEWTFSSAVLWVAVVGGLVFSAQSVYQYGCKLFRDRVTGNTRRMKAAAYCTLAEVIMTFAPSYLLPLSLAMLTILVAVNAIENGRNAGS